MVGKIPLTEQQRQQVQDWLNARKISPNCPTCGSKSLTVGDIISGNVLVAGGGLSIGGQNVPMVQVICKNCGHVRLFAARLIGII